jgi:hypothetical protein
MKINLIVGVVLLGVLFSSCEKWQVAEDIPDPEELVVVNAAFSPSDSVVAVYVGNASSDFQSAFLASELAINNAEVFVISGESRKRLTYSESSSLYEISTREFPIIQGRKYQLEVTANGTALSAECIVPENIPTPKLKVLKDGEFIFGEVSWQSIAVGQTFQLVGNATFINNRGFPQQVFGSWDYDLSKLLEADKKNQSFTQINTARTQGVLSDTTQIIFEVNLTTYDINGSRYLESARNANDSPQINVEFFNRFISPSIRYSNVKNGLGVVLAYNRQTVIEKLNSR